MIVIKKASKAFKNQVIFKDLDLEISSPGLYVIQGESGSGKTTLLNLLAGFESFDEGKVQIDENLATIFQNYELISELSIKENIFLTKQKISEDEKQLLLKLGIQELLDYYPKELSGGQKQRVGIARALLLNPTIVLCDEPTESLDIENKRVVMELLKELSKDCIVIVASHDQQMIDDYADEIFHIQNKRLICERKYSPHSLVQSHQIQKHKSRDIHRIVFKILKTRMIVVSICIALLSLFVLGLFTFEKKMFHVPDSTNMVNANMLYIEKNDASISLDEYEFDEKKLRPAIKFLSVNFNGVQTMADIFSYQENELPLEGSVPKKGEVLINQNVAKMLNGEWENESLDFTYSLNGKRHQVSLNICGVVEEESIGLSFYYNYDGLMEMINEQGILPEDAVTFLRKNGTFFEDFRIYSSAVGKIKEKKEGNPFSLYNPLYSQRLEFIESSAIYRIVFIVLEAILFLGILTLIVVYIVKDTKYYLRICAILASVQFSLNEIKKAYFVQKLCAFIPLEIATVELSTLMYHANFGYTYLTYDNYRVIHYALFVILCVYTITLVLCLSRLRMEHVSEILKESKDME